MSLGYNIFCIAKPEHDISKASVSMQKAYSYNDGASMEDAVDPTVVLNGKEYAVTGITKNAFKNSKAKIVTVKSKKLTKRGVKGCFKGSKVKTVKIKVGSKKANKKLIAKYKKFFTEKNCGAKVTVE